MHIIGSKSSSIKEFLDKVSPEIAVIGVGKNNKFGHPSEVTIENLKEMKVKIHRTDEEGEIKINATKNSCKKQKGGV